jgi:hypothetical protein
MVAIVPIKKPSYGVKVWIGSEDIERLQKLAEVTGLSQVELMSRIVHSGVTAIAEAGFRLSLPLNFEMKEAEPIRYPKPSNRAIPLNDEKENAPTSADPSNRVRHSKDRSH